MQVGFDANFFAKSLNDYSDWQWSFAREAMQNCIDSGADTITINISSTSDNVRVEFANNGRPMDEDTILNKLMNVGGTTKKGDCNGGEVGGFGVAKICLYFAHNKYTIESGPHCVVGQGGMFELRELEEPYQGTRSVVIMETDNPAELAQKIYGQFKLFASFAQWNGTLKITYNGDSKIFACALKKGYFRREFSFGRLYTNQSFNGIMIFRINGIPMFKRHVSYEGCAIFEATKGSLELMTSNRDSLKYQYQSEIDDVIQRFSTNRSSVLKREPTCEIYGDTLLGVRIPKKIEPVMESVGAERSSTQTMTTPYLGNESEEEPRRDYLYKPNHVPVMFDHNDEQKESDDHEESEADDYQEPRESAQMMMILNESGMLTPEHIKPGNMSSYSEKLLKIWGRLMCEVYRINNREGAFAVGFCLGDAVAKHMRRDGVTYYLINPFQIVEQDYSHSRSFKRKYHFVRDREDLALSAVHEFIHGALRKEYHDEQFSSILTTLAGVAMKHKKELMSCFNKT